MKVSGNLGHMSGGHLRSPGLSVALSRRLRGAYSGRTDTMCLSFHFVLVTL